MERRPEGQIRRSGAGFAFTLTKDGQPRTWWLPTMALARAARDRWKAQGWSG